MGFGFGNEEEEEEKSSEIEHNHYRTLKFRGWEELSVGLRVQSVLTGTIGKISNVDKKYFLVEIDWDNGKHSRQSKGNLEKVILYEEE